MPAENLLCWTDIEATGLDVEVDSILEVAIILTEGNLTELARFHAVTNKAKDWVIPGGAAIAPNVYEMHKNSGLWDESLTTGLPLEVVGEQLHDFLTRTEAWGSVMAGSSVYWDRNMLFRQYGWLSQVFHYRLLDVSTYHETAKRLWPEIRAKAPAKKNVHRAMADIEESMNYLRYYLGELAGR